MIATYGDEDDLLKRRVKQCGRMQRNISEKKGFDSIFFLTWMFGRSHSDHQSEVADARSESQAFHSIAMF